MKNIFVLVAALFPAYAFAAEPRLAPTLEVPVQETCREHLVAEPRITVKDWPKRALGREVSAYVVVSYDLDGSGKALNLLVKDSVPKGLFDKATLSILSRTEFAPKAQAQGCTYVRTYGSVRRAER